MLRHFVIKLLVLHHISKCHQHVISLQTWSEARQQCIDLDGYLAEVTTRTKPKLDAVLRELRRLGMSYKPLVRSAFAIVFCFSYSFIFPFFVSVTGP